MGSYGFTEDGIFVHTKSFGARPPVATDLGAGSELMVKAQPSQRKPGSWEATESKVWAEDLSSDQGMKVGLTASPPPARDPSLPSVRASNPETLSTDLPGGRFTSAQTAHVEQFCPLLLITGRPGVGKTTVLRRVRDLLNHRNSQPYPLELLGFITNEVRDPRGSGQRVGFKLSFFDDSADQPLPDVMMAHVDFPKSVCVGKYGVDVSAVDAAAKYLGDQLERRYPTSRKGIVAKSAKSTENHPVGLTTAPNPRTVVLLDEIGKMECLSRGFVHTLKSVLYREQWVIQHGEHPTAPPIIVATIAEKGGGLISDLKSRAGVKLVEVRENERDSLPQTLVDWIGSQ
jgi:nucleoside-triphosphatase